MKNTTKALFILLTFVLLFNMVPVSSYAEEPDDQNTLPAVSYMSPDGTLQTCSEYTPVTEECTEMRDGWYVVNRDVTFNKVVMIHGTVNLILCDGTTMNASMGILVAAKNNAALTIWGQRVDAGILNATGTKTEESAGIGTNNNKDYKYAGQITINGGTVNATGGYHAAGIGGGSGNKGGTVSINGGVVTAKGYKDVCAIGHGSFSSDNGSLTLYDLASVKAGLNESAALQLESARVHECQYSPYAKIEPCTHSHKEYEYNATGHRATKCQYCKMPAETAWTPHIMENGQCKVCGYREKIVPDNSGSNSNADKKSSRDAAETAIKNSTSDEGPSGTVFHLLQARQKKVKKHSITITWNRIPGASYIIYGNRCGRKNQYLKIAETGKKTFTLKRLQKGKYYKYIVLAVKDGEVVSVSKTLHIATAGGKYGNHTKVNISKKKLSLKKGKTKKLKAKAVIGKRKVKVHRGVKWESSNPNVATVRNGKIKAVGKGTAKIYAYAQNGKFAKCTVTVK